MSKIANRRTLWRIALPAILATTGLSVAWGADEVKIVTPPVTPGQSVTINQPAENTKVTISKDAAGVTHITHEAIVGPKYDDINTVVVKVEPPAPKEEVVQTETRPSPEYIWVAGYYQWAADRNSYEWVPGEWRRQVPDMAWHGGRWEKTDKGYVWLAGYWAPAKAKDTDIIVVKEAPPSPKTEVEPATPGADFAWIPGHWNYANNQYQWTAGRWERPASKDMVYVPGVWAHRGDGYIFISGHWDYPEESRAYVASRDKDRDKDREHEQK